MYNEKICQRLRANSVVSAWENQRLLRCEKWPRKEKTCRRTKCWNKATNDSNQLRRARMWTFRFPRLIEAVWTHPTSQMLFKSTISETGLYTLGTKAGTLNTRFSRNQFNLMNQKFLTTADVPEDVTLSVREAATREDKDFSSASDKLLVWQKNANASGTFGSSGWIGFLRTVCSEFELLFPKCKVLSQKHALEQKLWCWVGPDGLCQHWESVHSHFRPPQLVWIVCCFVPTFCLDSVTVSLFVFFISDLTLRYYCEMSRLV